MTAMAEVDLLTKLFTANINMSKIDVVGRVPSPPDICGTSPPYGVDISLSSESPSGMSDITSESLSPSSPLSSPVLRDGRESDSSVGILESGVRTCKKISRALRHQRNLAEKQRRDKLNTCIGKLAAMVPLVSMSQKRINKSGILRLTASYLRLHQGLLKGLSLQRELKPLFLTNRELGSFLLEALDGFMVILNNSAKVVFVSKGIERVLGHAVIDVLGQNILDFVHQDDKTTFVDNVLSKLTAWDFRNKSRSTDPTENISDRIPSGISFYCSMLEHLGDPKLSSTTSYKLVHIVGQLKLISNSIEEDRTIKQGQVDKFFIGVVKLCILQPFRQLPLNTNPNEVSFRTSLDGRCVFVDQRLSVVLGFMPSELIGTSGYEIIFHEDHLLSAVAHTQLLHNGGFRSFPVRLVTRTKGVLYFLSTGRLIRSQDSSNPDNILAICTLISNEEGEKALAMARHRYTPYTINMGVANIYDGVVCKSEHLLPLPGHEMQLLNEPPPKRPRGRPRKYPIGCTGGIGSNCKRFQSCTKVAKNEGNIKKDIEEFVTSYAVQLKLNLGNTRRTATVTEIDTNENADFGFDVSCCKNNTSDFNSNGSASKSSLDFLLGCDEEPNWCGNKDTIIETEMKTVVMDHDGDVSNLVQTTRCPLSMVEDDPTDIDNLEEEFFKFSR